MRGGENKDLLKVADRMRALCSRREYCSTDIMKKVLAALDDDKEAAHKIVSSLVEEKYIDDLRYASAYARDKSSIAGWGTAKIRYMLSAKGLPREMIAEALEEIDDSKAAGRLHKLLEAKSRTLKDDPQARLKMLRFGMGRGYSYEEVAEMTEMIMGKWKNTGN